MGLVTLQAAMTFQIFDIENVVGSSGRDTIIGDSGPNDLRGGIGADHILGLGGDDVLTGNGGTDDADGGDGTDTCSAETVVRLRGLTPACGDAGQCAAARSAPRRQRMPASVKSSRSPSKTAWVLPVSWPVRRSLTIW